jgi:short-subunit dehydrogenase
MEMMNVFQELTDIEEMTTYYRVNLFHVICLNSVFQSMFPKSRMAYINISSILALQPLTTWGNYCGGKAARYPQNKISISQH